MNVLQQQFESYCFILSIFLVWSFINLFSALEIFVCCRLFKWKKKLWGNLIMLHNNCKVKFLWNSKIFCNLWKKLHEIINILIEKKLWFSSIFKTSARLKDANSLREKRNSFYTRSYDTSQKIGKSSKREWKRKKRGGNNTLKGPWISGCILLQIEEEKPGSY